MNNKPSRSVIAQVIARRSETTTDVRQLGRSVAAYLLDAGRSGELASIMRDVMAYRTEQGQVEVLAVCAHPLTDSVRSIIREKIAEQYPDASTIMVSEILDPGVIGGVRLELANQQLDLTVRAKLNRFKQLSERTL